MKKVVWLCAALVAILSIVQANCLGLGPSPTKTEQVVLKVDAGRTGGYPELQITRAVTGKNEEVAVITCAVISPELGLMAVDMELSAPDLAQTAWFIRGSHSTTTLATSRLDTGPPDLYLAAVTSEAIRTPYDSGVSQKIFPQDNFGGTGAICFNGTGMGSATALPMIC